MGTVTTETGRQADHTETETSRGRYQRPFRAVPRNVREASAQ